MPFIQSTYAERITKAVAGMLADADAHVDTRICETAAGIGFGLAVGQGTSDNEAKLDAAAAADFVGITVRDRTLVNDSADKYEQYENMAVITRGDIWVTTGGVVSAGDDVTYSKSTGVLSSAAPSGTQFAITGARWMTSAGSGGLARVRLGGAVPSA